MNWTNRMATRYGDVLGTDIELKDWIEKGDVGVRLGEYGDYIRDGNMGRDDIKPEDIGKLSGDSLAALIETGIIDPTMAESALMINPNMTADKKIMLGALSSGLVKYDPNPALSAPGERRFANGLSINDFKKEAESLMNDHTGGDWGRHFGRSSVIDQASLFRPASGPSEFVDRWVKKPPTETRIVP